MRKNLGISLVEKLILIFFMSLGENFFLLSSFGPDFGTLLAPSFWIAVSFGSDLCSTASGT